MYFPRSFRASSIALLIAGLGCHGWAPAEDGGGMPPRPLPPNANEDAAPKDPKELDRRDKMVEKAGKKRMEKRMGEPEREPAEGLGMPPPPPGMAAQGLANVQVLLVPLNVVDRASLGAALALFQAGKPDEALAAAEMVAQKSPDPESAGVARLIAGRIQLESGAAELAQKTLRTVTGRAAPMAMLSLCAPLLKAGDADGLISAAKDLVSAQRNGLEQCRAAKAFLDLLSRPGPGMLAPGARAKVLAAAAEWIPYETALAAREALSKEPSPIEMHMERMEERQKGAPPPMGKGMKKGEKLDPEHLRAEIKKLEDKGMLEEAGKVKKQLEMLERPAGDALERF